MIKQTHKDVHLTVKMTTIFLIVVLLITSILSCIDDTPEDDPYAFRKKIHRHLRCKVNGKEWTYTNETFLAPPNLTGAYSEKNGNFSIEVRHKNEYKSESMQIFVGRDLIEGDNIIETSYPFRHYRPRPSKVFLLDTTYYNRLFIKEINTSGHYITGIFEYRAITEDKIDTILINDGEFDFHIINWYPK